MINKRFLILILIITIFIGLGCLGRYNNQPSPPNTEVNVSAASLSNQLKEGAPIQNAIKQAESNGTLSLKDMDGPPEYSSQILENNETNIKIKYTTTLKFKNPKGAGIESNKWPKIQIENGFNNNLQNENVAVKNENLNVATSIDYDQQIKDAISSEIKNIPSDTERTEINNAWNNYSFDSGERTYEINETYDGVYTNKSDVILETLPTGTVSSSNNILIGFTNYIHWQYSKEEHIDIPILWWKKRVAWARADIDLDAAFGLRLPTKVDLTIPNRMYSGQSYTLSSNIIGQDWNAEQYSDIGAPAENGNEFVARTKFLITARAWILVVGNIGPYTYNKDLDFGKSFKTPFGPNDKFPIPELVYSPDQTGLKFYQGFIWVGVGIKIEPVLGSDKITAKWKAEGNSAGEGSIEYNQPNYNYNFGPVKAEDYDENNKYAIIRLYDYNYYFNICKLNFGANVQGGLTFMPIKIQTPYMTILSIDCGGLTANLHLGAHKGTDDSINKYIEFTAVKLVYTGNETNTTENLNSVSPTMAYSVANTENENIISAVPAITSIGVKVTKTPTVTKTTGNITSTPNYTVNVTPTVTKTPTITKTYTVNITSTPNYTVNVTPNYTVNATATPNDIIPEGATAKCKDGTYSFSQHRQGTCSDHGGVYIWYIYLPIETPYVTPVIDTSTPYVTPVIDTSTPYVTPVIDTSTPYVTPVIDTSTPYVESIDTSTPYVEPIDTSTPYVEPIDTSTPYVEPPENTN